MEAEETPRQRQTRLRKEREQAKIRARRELRATYDLPPALREAVRALAEEQRVPASQLVSLALAQFFSDYAAGQIDMARYKHPSRSPRYDWNLMLPERMLPRQRRRTGKKKTGPANGGGDSSVNQ